LELAFERGRALHNQLFSTAPTCGNPRRRKTTESDGTGL